MVYDIACMFQYKLDLDDTQTKYDPEINPTLFNEFTTAAFRYGHSTIPGKETDFQNILELLRVACKR